MTLAEAVDAVANAPTWDARIAAIRLIPEKFGTAAHQEIYSTIARRLYVPNLAPDFAYVHWDEDYELPLAMETYGKTQALTDRFAKVTASELASVISAFPPSLRVFRLILGFTAQEFAAATALVTKPGQHPLTVGRIRSAEAGRAVRDETAHICAAVVDQFLRFAARQPTEMPRIDASSTVLVKNVRKDVGWEPANAGKLQKQREEANQE